MRCHKNHLKVFFYAERRIKLNKIPFLALDLAMLSSSLCYGRLLLFKNILNEINFSPQKYFNDLTFELGSSVLIR